MKLCFATHAVNIAFTAPTLADSAGGSLVAASSATVLLDGSQTLSSLTIQPGGTVRVLEDGSAVLETDALTIGN